MSYLHTDMSFRFKLKAGSSIAIRIQDIETKFIFLVTEMPDFKITRRYRDKY